MDIPEVPDTPEALLTGYSAYTPGTDIFAEGEALRAEYCYSLAALACRSHTELAREIHSLNEIFLTLDKPPGEIVQLPGTWLANTPLRVINFEFKVVNPEIDVPLIHYNKDPGNLSLLQQKTSHIYPQPYVREQASDPYGFKGMFAVWERVLDFDKTPVREKALSPYVANSIMRVLRKVKTMQTHNR